MKKSKNQKSPKAFGDLKNCISITFRLAAQVYQNKKFGFEIENEEVPTTYILLSLGYGWEKRRAAIEMEVLHHLPLVFDKAIRSGTNRSGNNTWSSFVRSTSSVSSSSSSLQSSWSQQCHRLAQPASALWNFLCVPGKTLSASFNRQVDQNTASEYILPSILLKEKSISQ